MLFPRLQHIAETRLPTSSYKAFIVNRKIDDSGLTTRTAGNVLATASEPGSPISLAFAGFFFFLFGNRLG